jgi:RHS repeat-associated protein
MLIPGRTFSSSSYRYGFNGKENDNEIKGEGNQQDYGMRIYDPRVGRFLSTDPLTRSYPWYTPYQFSGNNPICFIDLDGAEPARPLNQNNAGDRAAYLTATTVFDIRNSLTNTALRISPTLEKSATVRLLEKGGITDKSMQAELLKNYVARVITIVDDAGVDNMGNIIQETRREWSLTARNSAGKEFLAAAMDVLTIASTVPSKGAPLLFAKGAEAVSISQLKKSFSLLYHVRRLSSIGVNNALSGVHALEDVVEAGRAFVGKNAKKIFTQGGRFEGWESADGLKRFRPSAYKQRQGSFQANFEQRTSIDVDWNKAEGAKSNMHVNTDRGFDFRKENMSTNTTTGSRN